MRIECDAKVNPCRFHSPLTNVLKDDDHRVIFMNIAVSEQNHLLTILARIIP